MIAAYDPAEVDRLISEAREDGETIGVGSPICRCPTAELFVEGHSDDCPAAPIDSARDKAQRRALANLIAFADQLEAIQTELSRRTEAWSDAEHRVDALTTKLDAARDIIAELEAAPSTAASDLTACEEQRDVYRDRAQQLAGRVTELTTALRSLIARVRRTGGYASPEEQAALWESERVLGGDMGGVDGDLTRQTNAE